MNKRTNHMKIKYLGTAAFEGIPAMFCNCEVCKNAFKLGGKNIRTRSSALVNDDLLIDFNPDTEIHYQTYRFDMDKIDNCLITHDHNDHFYPEDALMAGNDYAKQNKHKMTYWAGRAAIRHAVIVEYGDGGPQNFENVIGLKEVEAYKIYKVGKYDVLVLKANHQTETTPLFYAISDGKKKLLYAHDSGYFFEETWQALKEFAKTGKFDLVSCDCTGALQKNWRDHHLSYDVDLEIFGRMKKEGIADENTKFVVNHFSHNGGANYDDLKPVADKDGVIVSYDGLEIEF